MLERHDRALPQQSLPRPIGHWGPGGMGGEDRHAATGEADQAVAIGRCRINRRQECHLILIDLINTQNTRELSDNPPLVVSLEIESGSVSATPSPDHAFSGRNPEVTSQPLRHAPEGETVPVDGVNGLLNHTLAVGRIHVQEGWLGTEVVPAGQTV